MPAHRGYLDPDNRTEVAYGKGSLSSAAMNSAFGPRTELGSYHPKRSFDLVVTVPADLS